VDPAVPTTSAGNAWRGRRRSWGVTRAASFGFTGFVVAALAGTVALFVWQSLPIWGYPAAGFPLGRSWHFRHELFGTLPMLYGTAVVAAVAMLVAAPLGIGAAVFSAEYLPPKPRLLLKGLIELLAGIPSVVYGLLGILILRNYVYDALRAMGLDPLSGDSLLTAGLLLSVMILPTVMTLADDALRAVPAAQRQAARGLGLSPAQTILSVSLPQARRGLVAALLLATGRALGEMIAVFLVVGRQDNQLPRPWWSLEPLVNAGQTMASKLGGAETNIAYGDPLHWAAMVGLGLLLLLLVTGVTVCGAWLGGRGRAGDHA
jgi:phosphate transport system permease protein